MNDYFNQPNRISLFKTEISRHIAQLKQQFDPQQSVASLLAAQADFMDALLTQIWQHFLGHEAGRHCLIAAGGYGRGNLFPYSDIDILLLLSASPNDELQAKLSAFSMFLWDIGLKPGQSVRTLTETLETAREDQTVFTNLLEMRWITGDDDLFEQLHEAMRTENLWPSEQFFPVKIAEQQQRYRRFHDTAYNLEPNVKEGPGGLRDLQVIGWVFKRHYNSPTLRGLIKHGFLPKPEYEEMVAAREILWRIRFALHSLTNRCEDRLCFDYQRELAERFGYVTASGAPDVEAFMQFYFKTVVSIERLNEMLLQLFDEKFISRRQDRVPVPITADFASINGYLEVSDKALFVNKPLAMFELFLLLQQSPSLKGIRATTIRLIRKHLDVIDEDFRSNPQANQLFMQMLRQPRGITHQLRRMNRYGILAAYLPDFANIVARMQYDLFHIYTVDEHTLFVIRNLRRFAMDEHRAELPFCNAIFLLIPKPDLLYIAALFHDIAKGLGGDHSTLGEEIVVAFCLQHRLPAHDTKLVAWLVRYHLVMSMTAQRKDIGDPEVIHQFAQQVGSIERLNYLYLLTVADIRATNPSLWNAWKDVLLKDLYIATHSALHRGLDNPLERCERIADNKKETAEMLLKLGMSQTAIQHSWQHLSEDYFLRYSADEIAWHTVAIAASQESDLPLVLLRPQTLRGSAEIFVYTRNATLLFSICTATIDQLGLTILDARIITTNDDYVLNSFQVLEQSGDAITDLHREIQIANTLRQGLLGRVIPEQTNIWRQSRQAKYFPIATQLFFLDDPLNRHTIVEIIATDRSGLLSVIGKVFNELDIQLHDAKITTIGCRAEDMFYITDVNNQPLGVELKQNLQTAMRAQLQ